MKNKVSIILLIVVGLLGSSCSDFLDVNKDPNNPTDVNPDLILPVGLNYTANYVQEDRGLSHLGNMLMYSFGESFGYSWYGTEFKYAVTSNFYSSLWNDAYSDALKQYEDLLDSSKRYGYYKAIGLIMEAYHFQILVDLYGDIPYSEALKRAGNTTPSYDKGAAVYDSLLVDLTKAVELIQSTKQLEREIEVSEGNGDSVFDGNMTKWIRFAHTIKVRILSRVSGVAGSVNININQELATIKASGIGFIKDDVTINPGYMKEVDKQNPFWADFGWDPTGTPTGTHRATTATQFVLNYFSNTNDPRIDYIFEKPETGHKGVNQGFPNNSKAKAPDKVSNIGPGLLKSYDMGSVIFTLAEHKFNMAELALAGYNVNKGPKQYYQAGVEASFAYLGVDNAASAAANYLSQNIENVSWSASTNKLDAIMTQQWIATMGLTAAQAWFDYNRTGYPSGRPLNTSNLEPASTGFPTSISDDHDDRPVRLLYPTTEQTTNAENVPNQSLNDAFGDDSKIFWAQ